ncbi:MAG: hypothetical protein M0010_22065, partial [Actinomycetota bacterium]|nr:hypothetical protein [Actinomycetota bacterium]
MNLPLAAKAGSAVTHEHAKGALVVREDTKSSQFDMLLLQACSRQIVSEQATSGPETSRQPIPSHRGSEEPQPVTRAPVQDAIRDVHHPGHPGQAGHPRHPGHPHHPGQAGTASAALVDLPLSTTAQRPSAAADVVSEAAPGPTAAIT